MATKFRMMRALDRYVLTEFFKIFFATALGFPVLVIVIDITENLDKYLQRKLPVMAIAQAYVYGVPETLYQVLPAAVLFATVFAIGGFTRHSEISAAKASGISFHRFIAPIAFGALLATGAGLGLAVLTPVTNALKDELLQEKKARDLLNRFNFTFASEEGGRVYQVNGLDVQRREIHGLMIDRKGTGPTYPTYIITSPEAKYVRRKGVGSWILKTGMLHVLADDSANITIAYDSLKDRHFKERPELLMNNSRAPEEMGYGDLGDFIKSMERSGSNVNDLRTKRMLKLAIPATCFIIMLFGAPLATSNQRGGAAYGIGVSLATTVIFLMALQFTQAIGGKGIVSPELAAWLPGILFASVGSWLLTRVRT